MYSDTLGFKQNNVGNLRGNGVNWQGKTGMSHGFSVFNDRVFGIRAIYSDLLVKIKTGNDTIIGIISAYAPPSENDTNSYVKFVESNTGISRDSKLTSDLTTVRKVVHAISLRETGYNIPVTEHLSAEQLLIQKKK